jgi:adenosylcobinamide-phosphate synthase
VRLLCHQKKAVPLPKTDGSAVTALAQHLLILTAALLVDRMIGDPQWLWQRLLHPVAAAGSLIDWLDRWLNRAEVNFSRRLRRGTIAFILLTFAAAALGVAIHYILSFVPLGFVVEISFAATLLAQKSLVEHVSAVARALSVDGLPAGRKEVARIVGRDVSSLDEAGVARAAIESAAENFSDGVVAPALWYALFGLPGLLAYKLVNTADSMIGHRTAKYAAFGWAAARTDDALNFVPARLSAALIVTAAWLTRRQGQDALHALRDAPKHKSPNAGWPEAALAGALGLALGGPRRYGEIAIDGAWLNAKGRRMAGSADIEAAIRQIDFAWAILTALTAAAAFILFVIAR